jgi:pyruvate dehydrogenase E1 component beta subunit
MPEASLEIGGRRPTAGGPIESSMVGALNLALRQALEREPKTLLLGEDIGRLGGVFRVTDGLWKDFGAERVVDVPLGESGIVGVAIGLAMRGYRTVCEIQFDGFIYPAFDQIVTQLSRMHYRTRGDLRMPVVIRVPFSGGIGAVEHHSDSPEVLFAHTPGLRVVACSTPQDAYGLLTAAIDSDDPVLFLEPKRRYWARGSLDSGADVPALDRAVVLRPGSDVTVAAYGPTVRTALDAAELAAGEGCAMEVIDLRSISPLDVDTVAASVRATGRLVIVHDAPTFFGVGAELAARITEECFFALEAPVLRVGGFAIPYPVARLEQHYLPDVDRLLEAVDRVRDY